MCYHVHHEEAGSVDTHTHTHTQIHILGTLSIHTISGGTIEVSVKQEAVTVSPLYKLPHGVHLKTLDIYYAIFDRIKLDGLSADLHVYCSGLFPLISWCEDKIAGCL